jgi:hypothetical protein
MGMGPNSLLMAMGDSLSSPYQHRKPLGVSSGASMITLMTTVFLQDPQRRHKTQTSVGFELQTSDIRQGARSVPA